MIVATNNTPASAAPIHAEWMDGDMRALWDRLEPLPSDLRLYGGTALALYLNHRQSTDFGFATPRAVVDPSLVRTIPAFAGCAVRGGPGMVDLDLKGSTRNVRVTLMKCGQMVPMPRRKPVIAPNGVAVAHPTDLVAAKIEACISRGFAEDYNDVAQAVRAWPRLARQAAAGLAKQGARQMRDIEAALADPPPEIAAALPTPTRETLRRFATAPRRQAMKRRGRGMEL